MSHIPSSPPSHQSALQNSFPDVIDNYKSNMYVLGSECDNTLQVVKYKFLSPQEKDTVIHQGAAEEDQVVYFKEHNKYQDLTTENGGVFFNVQLYK